MEKPTEDTYVAELVSVIKEVAGPIGFDAEFNRKSPSGKPDVNLYYKGVVVAVIEVKEPRIPLSDPALNKQALNYAEWYRKNRGVIFYGVHNMKYLNLFKYVAGQKREKTLLDFVGEKKADWASVSDFPFKIMPWVKSVDDFKQISSNRRARENLGEFLLKFKESLEGKSLDLSKEVIEAVRKYIEEGASRALNKFEDMYRNNERGVQDIFEEWRNERGIEKPKNDEQFREFLTLMVKEQLYTFSMKVLFYLVLQSIDAEMASKLKENLASIEPSDPELFEKIFGTLFGYAIQKTGDFEEVFGTNTVDKLPFTDATIQSLKELISYLNQIRWSEIKVEVIGRIFERLIYTERRHLLGQHYTDTPVVDLILASTLHEPGKLIDPACGSGTFLVRALNYWKTNYSAHDEIYTLVEGIDIDKLASMLSKINLYIQALKEIKERANYYPKISQSDFFKTGVLPEYSYITTNPPYTRQEEMAMAFYDKEYKKYLTQAVEDLENWSKRASIYAYFLIKGAKLLRDGGGLGFIVENSWLNAEYGGPLKCWFLNNFTINYVIESLVERWFEDAAVITNILIAEKTRSDDYAAKFVYLKKPLQGLFGAPPPSSDFVANQRYYEKIGSLLSTANSVVPINDYTIYEDDDIRIVSVKKRVLEIIEKKLGKWGIIKGPKRYLEVILEFLEDKEAELKLLGDILDLERGLTTNANEIFYLPSKYWTFLDEDESYLTLKGPSHKTLKIAKQCLRHLIRPSHIEDATYTVSTLKKERHEDYVLWIVDTSKVGDHGTREYLKWATAFIAHEYETDSRRFPTLVKEIESAAWTRLPEKSGATFFLKNGIHKNFAIYLNNVPEAQVDKRLFLGKPKVSVDEEVMFAVLNSVFSYFGMELIGRSNLGEGALDVNVIDYMKIPVVDPIMLKEKLEENDSLQDFKQVVGKILNQKPQNVDVEVENEMRLKMEEYVLGSIGVNKNEIFSLYKELMSLVNLRAERALSVRRT